MTTNNAILINQTSGKVEYYTPRSIVNAARRLMGSIDLDPASCVAANSTVEATKFYSMDDDGLTKSWHGNVWLNHPFGRGINELWINKLEAEWYAGNIAQACCITYACTSERWFAPLLRWPQFFFTGRVNYLLPNGEVKIGVTKGSVLTYLYPSSMTGSEAALRLADEFCMFSGVAK